MRGQATISDAKRTPSREVAGGPRRGAAGCLLGTIHVVLFIAVLSAAWPRVVWSQDATVAVDVIGALGFGPGVLEGLVDEAAEHGQKQLHVFWTLQDEAGEYLAEQRVRFTWEGGSQQVRITRSGLIHFDLTRERLANLAIQAPAGYTRLRQRSLPESLCFENEPRLPATYGALEASGDLINDEFLRERLQQQVQLSASARQGLPEQVLREQLRRKRVVWSIPAKPAESLTRSALLSRSRDAVVLLGVGDDRGHFSQASGVILDPSGLVVTNHHVLAGALEHPGSVVGVMLRDGRYFPMRELYAASKADDVALLDVEARGLPWVPLSAGDLPGEEVTVLSHPDGRYYCATEGIISRYERTMRFGLPVVSMSITADYAVGSSGAAVFNSQGAVAGLVSSTRTVGDQMVFKDCVPAQAIRAMVEPPRTAAP